MAYSTPLVLLGAHLIDGSGRPAIADAAVVIDGERIVAVGPRAAVPIPQRAVALDVRGKFIIPGLVDMHVHVGHPDDERLALFLAAGVTTVLDLGGQIEPLRAWRTAIELGEKAGPRLLFTGPVIEEGKPYPPFAHFSHQLDRPQQVTDLVNAFADSGVDAIKLYITVRPDTARRACEAAHRRGLRVFMHQQATWGADAAENGVDCLEHLMVFGDLAPADGRPDAGAMTPFEYGGWMWRWLPDLDVHSQAVARMLDRIVQAGTALDPTLVLFAARPAACGLDGGDRSIDDPLSSPAMAYLAPAIAESVRGRWQEREQAGQRASTRARARTQKAWENLLELVNRFHSAGGRLLAGTDCPNVAIIPGYSLHRELELLTYAGLTPLAAIRAATRSAAERLDREHEFGTVAPGLTADLVLLDADPLVDIRNTSRINRVICRGEVMIPAQVLSAISSPSESA